VFDLIALVYAGIELNVQGIDGAQREAKLGARMPFLDLDHPFAADTNLLGEGRLVELELFASVTDDSSEVGGSANKHAMS
jgi:hypothetical protein